MTWEAGEGTQGQEYLSDVSPFLPFLTRLELPVFLVELKSGSRVASSWG